MAKVKNVVGVALAANVVSAAAFSSYMHKRKTNSEEVKIGGVEYEIEMPGYLAERAQVLSVAQDAAPASMVTYMLAGIGSTAEESFSAFVPYLDGVVKYVDFDPLRYDPTAVASMLLDDIQQNGYSGVRIIANSMAGQVIYRLYCWTDLKGIRAYIIDPIFYEHLKPKMRVAATALSVLLHGANLVGGWLRYMPIPAVLGWNWRTTELLADQMSAIMSLEREPAFCWEDCLDGVVVSEEDWFSDHEAYTAVLKSCGIPHAVVKSDYCNTKNHASAYIEALRELGALDWDVVQD